MAYLLGIDGGGTRTTAWLADEHLHVLAKVETGPSNPVKVGLASAQRELFRAAQAARRRARLRGVKLDAVCVGLAGAASAAVHDPLLRWLRESIPARAHLLTIDAVIALAVAVGDAAGIVVIAGTGSIAYGRDENGQVLRSGGWGSLFDDAGSGYDIGRKAIAGALRAIDGRGGPTSLVDALSPTLGVEDVTEAASKLLTAQEVAALFPVVLREAQAGDAFAQRLCREAGDDLAELALALMDRLGWKRQAVPVLCSGGVFRASIAIRRSFTRRLRARAPEARVSLLEREHVEGALYLARQLTCH